MAVTDVRRIRNGERINDSDNGTVTWCYHIIVDDPSTTIEDAKILATAMALPARGEIAVIGVQPFNVDTVDVERVENTPIVFLATVTLKLRAGGGDDSGGDNKSQDVWEVKVSKRGLPYVEPVHADNAGKPVANSAGVQYDPIPTITKYDEQFTISFNTKTLRTDQADACRGKTNRAPVVMNVNGYRRTFAVDTLLLVSDSEDSTVRPDGTPFWGVTIELVYKADTHSLKLVDRGMQQKSGTDVKPILDANNQPVTEPRYLDGSGAALSSGSKVVIRTHDVIKDADYGPLLAGIATATV